MPTKTILENLPGIYAHLLPEFFKEKIPNESFVTCYNCAMVRRQEEPHQKLNLRPYLPDVMCCSYYPGLPNYLIGGLLQDTEPVWAEGRKRIKVIIRKKTGVSPLGIQPPAKYSLLFTRTDDAFGQSKSLLCPYFHRGKRNCTIWKYREATCATFFCKTTAANTGKTFWKTLRRYLFFIQQQLCNYVLLESDFDDVDEILNNFNFGPQKVEKISVTDLEELPPAPENHERLWQNWTGREEEFYRTAYRLINRLSTKELDEITGVKQKMLLKKLKKNWDQMMGIPSVLIKNPDLNLEETGHKNYVVPYESIDTSFEVPKVLLDSFNGSRPYHEVLQLLEEKYNIEVDEAFILSLYHYEVLVEKPG